MLTHCFHHHHLFRLARDHIYSKPIEIITTLWEKIKGSENESTFLSIMHTLLHLGLSLDGGSQDPTLSKKVWGIIDKLLRQFDLMGNGTTLLRSLH
jgi:hypothetical protein